jgi:hypothetical protein
MAVRWIFTVGMKAEMVANAFLAVTRDFYWCAGLAQKKWTLSPCDWVLPFFNSAQEHCTLSCAWYHCAVSISP